jgi:hypothetical protein
MFVVGEHKEAIMSCKNQAMADREIIFTVQESPKGGYEAKALGHSIYTQADSLEL